MTDVIVVNGTDTIVVESDPITTVITAGQQGPAGPIGPSTSITDAPDVDTSNLQNGSLLVYSSQFQKWVANTQLDNQSLESGHY